MRFLAVAVFLAVSFGGAPSPSLAASDNPAELRRACNNGHAWSCAYLAVMHRHGRGTERNYVVALSLFVTACEAGNTFACGSVGEMTFTGKGIAANKVNGARLLRGACHRKNTWSCHAMRKLGITPLTN